MPTLQDFAQLFSSGQYQAAADLAIAEQQQHPLDADWLNAVALALHACGQSREALFWMGRALALSPERGDFHNNFGVMLRREGWHAEAFAAYRRALHYNPGDLDALRNLVRALTQDQQADEAALACRQFCQSNPERGVAWQLAGQAELALKHWPDAIHAFRQAVELDGDNPENWHGLAQACNSADQLEAGEAALRRALQLAPEDIELLNDLGACLAAACRYDEALSFYDAVLARDPQHAKARYNRGTLRLRRGEWSGGWPDYDGRLDFPETQRPELKAPLWDGTPLQGDLLIHAEQGLGDTLQFLRFLPLARQHCQRLIFEVQPVLLPLLSPCPGADQVIARGQPLPATCARLPLLSLPSRLGLMPEDLPGAVAYLADRVPPLDDPTLFPPDHLKVGLVWAGNPKHSDDRHRSISPDLLRPLLGIPGCRFYSLQFGLAECPLPGIINLSSHIADWRDTAALLQSLDLLISVDTSVAHLAAAIGKPVWMLIAARHDWRWQENRDDSPWYPTLRLFRQQQCASWEGVIAQMVAALRSLAEA